MKINIINKETNEIINQIDNVVSFTDTSANIMIGSMVGKIYCDDDKKFVVDLEENEFVTELPQPQESEVRDVEEISE